jgi:hypothetical protein
MPPGLDLSSDGFFCTRVTGDEAAESEEMERPCSLRIDEATLQPRFPRAKCKIQKLKKRNFLL